LFDLGNEGFIGIKEEMAWPVLNQTRPGE